MPQSVRRRRAYGPNAVPFPCSPAFEQAAAQLEPQVRLAKVNTEDVQSLGARFNIRSIPTLALFRGGKEIARQPGAMGMADIVRWTRAQLAQFG